MWQVTLRIKERVSTISIWAAFFVPGIGFIAVGYFMVGYILIGISVILGVSIIFKPLRTEIPPLHIAVKNSKVVWGLWFTGDRMLKEGLIERYDSIKKILLLEPDSQAFRTNLEITKASEEKTKKEIWMLTKKAVEKGVDVRWYSRHEGIGLTMYDPSSNDEPSSNKAWCVVQILERYVPREERPTYKRRNVANGEGYFKGMFDKFTEIWNSNTLSRKPERKEYEGVDMVECENKQKDEQKGER